jgi:hypothetical protein
MAVINDSNASNLLLGDINGVDQIFGNGGDDTVNGRGGGGVFDGGPGIDLLIVQTEDSGANIDMQFVGAQNVTEADPTPAGEPLTFVDFERINFSTQDLTSDTVRGDDFDRRRGPLRWPRRQ